MPSDDRNAGGSIRASGYATGPSPLLTSWRESLEAFSSLLSSQEEKAWWASILSGGCSVYR